MAGKVEHIGIFVRDFEESLAKYTSLLGLPVKTIQEVNLQGNPVKVAFLPVGDIHLELVSTTSNTGLVADALRTRGEGVHHIAFEVEDIEREFHRLSVLGVRFVWDKIVDGSRGTRIAVIEGHELNGVCIELVQKPG